MLPSAGLVVGSPAAGFCGALHRHQGLIHPVGGTKQAWQREGSWCSRCAPLGQVLPKREPIGGKRQRKKEARKQGNEERGGMEGGGLHCRGAKLPSNAGLNC